MRLWIAAPLLLALVTTPLLAGYLGAAEPCDCHESQSGFAHAHHQPTPIDLGGEPVRIVDSGTRLQVPVAVEAVATPIADVDAPDAVRAPHDTPDPPPRSRRPTTRPTFPCVASLFLTVPPAFRAS